MAGAGGRRPARDLGDFTADRRLLFISALAVGLGALGTVLALVLLKSIAFFTNVFFFQTLDFADRSPTNHGLGALVVAVPIAGGLIIGLMARYGSERIRGHGIPEAIEAILLNGSRVDPRLALLKPLSAAISIGSGGPFGAEGPIIMTGGAFGSLTAQFLHLTSAERKTLLVAGAAAGMSATFAAPASAALLAVELLLFEWKPRSLVPVALASITAAVLRHYWIAPGPLFPTATHEAFIGLSGAVFCLAAGLLGGLLSAGLTASVYFFEDVFLRLPLHWMWWPAIGGLFVGLGGLVFPEALGVGYQTIGALLQADVPVRLLAGILLVKWAVWAIALGSGTSGGVLAPLLMIGGALGGLASRLFPDYGLGFWTMVGMASTLGGTMRVPFTAIVFALELTHEFNMLFPLMVAVCAAYGFTVLVMKRSILTEKVSRRGFHVSREYAVDPLETMFVREVMRTSLVVLSPSSTAQDLASLHRTGAFSQRLFPVVTETGEFEGVVTGSQILELQRAQPTAAIAPLVNRRPVAAHPDEPLRAVAYRMAEHGVSRLPVVERDNPSRLVGLITLRDLLQARVRMLAEERHRERTLRLRVLRRGAGATTAGHPMAAGA
ncbi:MAG TPA: chloride channel protein [Vicinamibacterales bacterium]|nr:chloride channel protein [Vicinamibacterales bacterium]